MGDNTKNTIGHIENWKLLFNIILFRNQHFTFSNSVEYGVGDRPTTTATIFYMPVYDNVLVRLCHFTLLYLSIHSFKIENSIKWNEKLTLFLINGKSLITCLTFHQKLNLHYYVVCLIRLTSDSQKKICRTLDHNNCFVWLFQRFLQKKTEENKWIEITFVTFLH